MIELKVFNGNIQVCKPETLTTGRVGHKIYISFDKKWEGLTNKKATFQAGNLSKVVPLNEGSDIITKIPVEVLKSAGYDLKIAIKGYDEELETILPTKYARLGIIHQGGEILEQESVHMKEDYDQGGFDLNIATPEEIDEMLDDVFQK